MLESLFGGGSLFGGEGDNNNMILIILLVFLVLGGGKIFGGEDDHGHGHKDNDGFLGGLLEGNNIIWILIAFLFLSDIL